jgi:hypothetical protein
MAPLAGPQAFAGDAGLGRARQAQHRKPGGFADASNLTIPALVKHDHEPGLVALEAQQAHVGRTGRASLDHDALAPTLERLFISHSAHLRHVFFGYAAARMQQLVSEVAVVGAQDYAARVVVEPTDRHHACADSLQQICNRLSAFGIAQRAHHAAWLVQHQVDERFGHDPPSVHVDPRHARIHAHAQLTHDATVDLDATLEDQGLRGTPRRDAGARQHLLQSFFGHIFIEAATRGAASLRLLTSTRAHTRIGNSGIRYSAALASPILLGLFLFGLGLDALAVGDLSEGNFVPIPAVDVAVEIQVVADSLQLAVLVDFPDVGLAVPIGVALRAGQLAADVKARLVRLAATAAIDLHLRHSPTRERDPGVDFSVVVRVGKLAQRLAAIVERTDDVLRVIEVGVDLATEQHPPPIIAAADDAEDATNVRVGRARASRLGDFPIRAPFEVAARTIIGRDARHFLQRRLSLVGAGASAGHDHAASR